MPASTREKISAYSFSSFPLYTSVFYSQHRRFKCKFPNMPLFFRQHFALTARKLSEHFIQMYNNSLFFVCQYSRYEQAKTRYERAVFFELQIYVLYTTRKITESTRLKQKSGCILQQTICNPLSHHQCHNRLMRRTQFD